MSPVLKQVWKRYFWFFVIFFLILIFLIASFFFKDEVSFENKKEEAKTEARILADRVGEHMFLPVDEVPTIATVSDPESLKDQTFFQDAKKGYKVLIYSNAKKAILYDPNADKIVTIAPLSIEGTETKNKTPTQNNSFNSNTEF